MGRGGAASSMGARSPVPVVRRQGSGGMNTSMSKLRAPGTGYDHKRLTLSQIYSQPVRVGGTGGAQKPAPRNPQRSHAGGVVGNRGKTGRAVVGASNRRTTTMGRAEVLNATGKNVLNADAVVAAEGSYHNVKRKEHLPGRATKEPNLTQGFDNIGAEIVQRELLGPPGIGPVLASESNIGEIPVSMGVDNPEPTSGRGRQSKNEDCGGGAEAVRGGAPLVKYKPRLVSEDEKVLGQKNVDTQIQGADINDQNPAAKPPKVPVKASLYLPKSDDLDIKPNTYGRVRPSRFTLDNVRMIPGLRGATQVAVPGLRYMPVDVLTDKAEVKEKVEGMGMSGLQILKEVAQWVRARLRCAYARAAPALTAGLRLPLRSG